MAKPRQAPGSSPRSSNTQGITGGGTSHRNVKSMGGPAGQGEFTGLKGGTKSASKTCADKGGVSLGVGKVGDPQNK